MDGLSNTVEPMETDTREKVCGRCGHVWISHTETPVRCPNCGTYHWQGNPTTNVCVACGHTWFSRSTQVPLRCPRCKTRAWMDESLRSRGDSRRGPDDGVESDVVRRYSSGDGCVKISMDTGLPLSTVIKILKEDVCNGRTPNM